MMLHTLYTLEKPTIACVRGAVRGGGVGLVAACDIAIAERGATFRLSEVKLGIIPAMISPYVVAAIGERIMRIATCCPARSSTRPRPSASGSCTTFARNRS